MLHAIYLSLHLIHMCHLNIHSLLICQHNNVPYYILKLNKQLKLYLINLPQIL